MAPNRPSADTVASFLPLTALALEILLAVAAEPRHGYDVLLEVEKRSQGRISPNPGTLYRAVHRLVVSGLVKASSQMVEGERRKVFAITALGDAVLAAETERLHELVKAARHRQRA